MGSFFDKTAERFKSSLSAKVLAMVVIFVLVAEAVVLIPSVAKHRMDWLHERVEAAYIVGLAFKSPYGEMIKPEEARRLFATANVIGVVVERGGERIQIMTPPTSPDQLILKQTVRLDKHMPQNMIYDAWASLTSKGDKSIRVIGRARYAPDGVVDIVVSERALRRDLLVYARNIALLSLVISSLAAILIFRSLTDMIVAPVKRLSDKMALFQRDPEDPLAIIKPTARKDEIGVAERSLAALEKRIQLLLSERERLAALGAGISKISHDLRNVLASAQLMSDRLAASEDPRVRRLSPRLISALDRAIALSRDTLSYARLGPESLQKARAPLAKIVEEAFDDAAHQGVMMVNAVDPELSVLVDRTQLYRALHNLVRNCVDALTASDKSFGEAAPTVTIRASDDGATVSIDIIDNGPGLPAAAREELFEPFKGSFKPGGSGLGVAIAYEVARAHGGALALTRSDDDGAVFTMTLPKNADA